VFASVRPIVRLFWWLTFLGCLLACAACGGGTPNASIGPYPGTATLIGIVQNCGGPHLPGRPIYCQSLPGVHVAATMTSGRYKGEEVRGPENRPWGFNLGLRPGHWKVVVSLGTDRRERYVQMQAHEALRVHFRFNGIK
jgi:hypothetical protein